MQQIYDYVSNSTDLFRYSLGVIPYFFLKMLLKYLEFPIPTRSEIDATLHSGMVRYSFAFSRRTSVIYTEIFFPVCRLKRSLR